MVDTVSGRELRERVRRRDPVRSRMASQLGRNLAATGGGLERIPQSAPGPAPVARETRNALGAAGNGGPPRVAEKPA